MKKIISLCLVIVLAMGILAPTMGFAYEPSDWAKSNIEKAMKLSILSEEYSNKSYQSPISRGDFINIAVNLYATITAENVSTSPAQPFTDNNDPFPNMAFYLQIVSGDGEGHFFPKGTLTRQEMCKIITSLLAVARAFNDLYTPTEDVFSSISDADDIAPWAKNHVAFMIDYNLMAGDYETGAFRPNDPVTREEAGVIAYRCLVAFGRHNFVGEIKTNLRTTTNAKGNKIYTLVKTITLPNGVTVSLANADNIDVTEQNPGNGTDGNQTGNPPQMGTGQTEGLSPNGVPLQVADANGYYKLKKYSETLESGEAQRKVSHIFPDGKKYTTAEEASAHMSQITVNVWKVDDAGKMYSSTLSFKVNTALKDDVFAIFEEIYKSPKKAPIKDASAYAWRSAMSNGAYSDHNYGTAIDLNYFENQCKYANGQVVGGFYDPDNSIYSFPSDGIVVQTFAKYGWLWGGNAWDSGTVDNMHFSYLGK